MRPTVLTIAGSDSGGGAGIQADLKAIAARGGYGATALTAVTAQNSCGVVASEVLPPRLVEAQLCAVFDDLSVRAVKTGMLGSAATIETVARVLRARRAPHLVCDPVLVSESGDRLLPRDGIGPLAAELLPLAELCTPNAAEAEALCGMEVRGPDDAERAARKILELGCGAVLVTGGHLVEARGTDVLVTRGGVELLAGPLVPTPHTHGTGCTYSAAIATELALGLALPEAVRRAKAFVTEALRHGFAVGRGAGPTDPFFFLAGAERAREVGDA